MQIKDARMDQLVYDKEGNKIHCHIQSVYSSPHQLAWGVAGGGRTVYGYHYGDRRYIEDGEMEVMTYDEFKNKGLV